MTAFAQDNHSQMMGRKDSQSMPSDMHSMMMKGSPNASSAPYDLQFISTMSTHHMMAIEMSRLAESRSSHDELKSMAKKMIQDQEAEIEKMKMWKQQWYPGKTDAVNMTMPGMMSSMKGMSMEKLEKSNGKQFDLIFLDMMSKHHAGAVNMAKSAIPKLKHPEAKTLAQEMVAAQGNEIAQMKQWRQDWK